MSKYINPYRMFNGSIIPNWLMVRGEINSSDKLVYARLGQYAGKKGVAFPCKATLAKEVGLKPDYVSDCLKKLAGLGLIEVSVRARADAPNRSNEYRFLDHAWIYEEEEDEDSEEGGGGAPPPPRGCPAPPYPVPGHPQRGGPATPFVRESGEETHGRESEESGTRASLSSGSSAEGEDIRGRSEEHPDTEGRQSPGTDELEERIRHAREVARTKLAEGSDKKVNAKAAAGEKKLLKQQKKAAALKEAQERGEVEAETQEGSPLGRLERAWREEFRKAFPETPLAARWGMKQFGQAKQVLALYDVAQVEDAIAYLIHNWKTVRAKLLKNSGDATPGVGVLTYFHESLVPNAALWSKYRDVFDRYASYDPNPDVDRPKALRQEYAAACRELEGLGL